LTSPTTKDVALNLASSKLRDTSGDSRMQWGAGVACLRPKAEYPSPDRAAARHGAEGDSPVRGRRPSPFACLSERSERVLGAPRAHRAGYSGVCRRACGQSRICRSSAGTAGGSPPELPYSTRGTGTQLPPFQRQLFMLVLSLKGPSPKCPLHTGWSSRRRRCALGQSFDGRNHKG